MLTSSSSNFEGTIEERRETKYYCYYKLKGITIIFDPSSNEDIIQLIKEGGHDDIGAEKLRGLLKILPEVDELEMLKSFDGDKSKLGNAEKFFLQLIQVPK